MPPDFWDKRAKKYDDRVQKHDALYVRSIEAVQSPDTVDAVSPRGTDRRAPRAIRAWPGGRPQLERRRLGRHTTSGDHMAFAISRAIACPGLQ